MKKYVITCIGIVLLIISLAILSNTYKEDFGCIKESCEENSCLLDCENREINITRHLIFSSTIFISGIVFVLTSIMLKSNKK